MSRRTGVANLALASISIVAGLGLFTAGLLLDWPLQVRFRPGAYVLGGLIVAVGAMLLLFHGGTRKPAKDKELVSDSGNILPPLLWARQQIEEYEAEANRDFALYATFKVPAMLAAAALPVFALAGGDLVRWAAGILGAVIVLCDGVQHLFRYRENWLNAVKTREALEHEVQRYGVAAGIYKDSTNRAAVLVERAGAIIADEYASWYAGFAQQRDERGGQDADSNLLAPVASHHGQGANSNREAVAGDSGTHTVSTELSPPANKSAAETAEPSRPEALPVRSGSAAGIS